MDAIPLEQHPRADDETRIVSDEQADRTTTSSTAKTAAGAAGGLDTDRRQFVASPASNLIASNDGPEWNRTFMEGNSHDTFIAPVQLDRTPSLPQLPLPPPNLPSQPLPLDHELPAPPTSSDAPALPPPAAPAPPPPPPPPPPFPALHLVPLNETFVPKQITLTSGGPKVKIGRQTNVKTIPNGTNGYFDSKVLSRMHAEVWCEQDRVFIKDVKSSNGTFINGDRLSPESTESDIFELHSDDTVEFGIDIVSDDNKTIVHHKVAARVFVVMNADDLAKSAREFAIWHRLSSELQARRANKANGMGSNGFSFDHVLSRLQGELQKSRDTGADLGSLSATLDDVHDTLSGASLPLASSSTHGLPFPHPHPSRIPPYIPNSSKDQQAQSIVALQAQLDETQRSLSIHVGKVRVLEEMLGDQEGIKREVGSLRGMMEEARRDMLSMMQQGRDLGSNALGRGGRGDGRESPVAAMLEAEENEDDRETEAIDGGDNDDDDDARSVSSAGTIGPPSMRSRTMANGHSQDPALARESRAQNARLATRIETLSTSLDDSMMLSQSLRAQHSLSTSTIDALEKRVEGLERLVQSMVASERDADEKRWSAWKLVAEEGWRLEREGWARERERLIAVVREWEDARDEEEDSSGSEVDLKAGQTGEGSAEAAEADDDVLETISKDAARGKRSRSSSSRKRRNRRSSSPGSHQPSIRSSMDSNGSAPASSLDQQGRVIRKSAKGERGAAGQARNRGTSIIISPSNNTIIPYAGAGVVLLVGIALWGLTSKVKD